jgi:MFS family permease
MPATAPRHDPYAAFRHRDCRLLIIGDILAAAGRLMQSVAVGWELYERTGNTMALAWVGLVQALPIVALVLPSGHVADRFDRKKVVVLMQILIALASAGLALLSHYQGAIPLIYLCLLLSSVAQSFNGAAKSALLPLTVPIADYSNAVIWKSGGFQIASVAGPAVGGFLIALRGSAASVYVVDAVLNLVFAACVAVIRVRHEPREKKEVTLRSLAAGFRFVWKTKVILATITLDLFAVLLGGATSLLPVYAKDILHVGPVGLGWLRAAPAVGAFAMGLAIAHLPPRYPVGKMLLWAVAGFGAATVGFGLSTVFWFSLLMLLLTGAFDNISVVVRHSLVQLLTPDKKRGRVSAVNNVFISCSNELGAFESGFVASIFGSAVISVVSGGLGTILVVLLTARLWPEIARLKSLHHLVPSPEEEEIH